MRTTLPGLALGLGLALLSATSAIAQQAPAATPAPAAPATATPAPAATTPTPAAATPTPAPAAAQPAAQGKEHVGSWTLSGVTVTQGENPFGANSKGQLMLGADGRFALIVARPDLPKYKSGSRFRGTADEYQATGQGSLASFGTYTVDGGKIVFKVEVSSFPNLNGESQERALKIAGDDLSYSTPPNKAGGVTTINWKRVK